MTLDDSSRSVRSSPFMRAWPKLDASFQANLVSVIIPTFNRRDMVVDAMQTVVEQSWQDVEIIVVDDGSDDGTADNVKAWHRDHRDISLTIVQQDNKGAAAARNHGATKARGEFIYFLDSDDLIYPDALQILADKLSNMHKGYALAHIHSSSFEREIIANDHSGLSRVSKKELFENRWMTHAALYRRTTILKSGLFREDLCAGEDTEFHWRVISVAGTGALADHYIGIRRQHSFGHLGLHTPPQKQALNELEAELAFRLWLAEEGFDVPHISWLKRVRMIQVAINLGRAEDWRNKDRAFHLVALSVKPSSIMRKMVAAAQQPNWQPYYGFLSLCLRSARRIASGVLTRPAPK